MEEFNTLEKVKKIFDSVNCKGEENCYFIAYKDQKNAGKNAGIMGGIIAGIMVGINRGNSPGFIGGATIGATIGVILAAVGTFTAGLYSGMKHNYHGLLINHTENGFGIIKLKDPSSFIEHQNVSKMNIIDNSYFFIKNEDIKKISVHNIYYIIPTAKTIKIKLKNKDVYHLSAHRNEKLLPYHDEGLQKFFMKYSK